MLTYSKTVMKVSAYSEANIDKSLLLYDHSRKYQKQKSILGFSWLNQTSFTASMPSRIALNDVLARDAALFAVANIFYAFFMYIERICCCCCYVVRQVHKKCKLAASNKCLYASSSPLPPYPSPVSLTLMCSCSPSYTRLPPLSLSLVRALAMIYADTKSTSFCCHCCCSCCCCCLFADWRQVLVSVGYRHTGTTQCVLTVRHPFPFPPALVFFCGLFVEGI